METKIEPNKLELAGSNRAMFKDKCIASNTYAKKKRERELSHQQPDFINSGNQKKKNKLNPKLPAGRK